MLPLLFIVRRQSEQRHKRERSRPFLSVTTMAFMRFKYRVEAVTFKIWYLLFAMTWVMMDTMRRVGRVIAVELYHIVEQVEARFSAGFSLMKSGFLEGSLGEKSLTQDNRSGKMKEDLGVIQRQTFILLVSFGGLLKVPFTCLLESYIARDFLPL